MAKKQKFVNFSKKNWADPSTLRGCCSCCSCSIVIVFLWVKAKMVGLSSTVKLFFLLDYFDGKLKKTLQSDPICPLSKLPHPPYYMIVWQVLALDYVCHYKILSGARYARFVSPFSSVRWINWYHEQNVYLLKLLRSASSQKDFKNRFGRSASRG